MRSPYRAPAALALLGAALVAVAASGAMRDLAAVLWGLALAVLVTGAVMAARASQRTPRDRRAAHVARRSRS